MRQFGAALLWVLALYGHALGAVNTGSIAGRERGESDEYVARFQNAHTAARNAHPQPVADQPPLDMIAMPHAFALAEPAFKACADARVPTDPIVSANRCYMAVLKDAAIAEGLRDMDLFDAFSTTALQMAADVDAGKLPRTQYNAAYKTLTDAYDRAVLTQYAEYLAARAKPAQGDAPPFDQMAVAAAEAALKQTACDAAMTSGAALAACLLARTTAFNTAIRVSDPAPFDVVIAAAKRSGEAADTGRMTREELRAGYGALENAWRVALLIERERWVSALYVARMDARYDVARRGKSDIPRLALSAAPQAMSARNQAQTACDTAQDEAHPNAWLECYLTAEKTFVAALEMEDRDLYDAFDATARQAGTEADAGKLTPVDLSNAYSAMTRNFYSRLERQGIDYEASQFSAAYIAQFDKDYAAYKSAAPAQTAQAGTPPYDPAMAETASFGLAADLGACGEKFLSDAERDVCYRAGMERFGTVLKLQDRALLDAYRAVLLGIRGDVETGKLSVAAARGLLYTISGHFSELLGAQQLAYLGIVGKPVADEYVARFVRFYDGTPHPLGVQAPYEASAMPAAQAAREKANAACVAQDQANSAALMECFIEARKAWTTTLKIRDTALQDAYVATLRAIAADVTAGKFDKRQVFMVLNAVMIAYSSRLDAQQAEWERRQTNLLVAEYVERFHRAHLTAAKPMPDSAPPFDAAVLENTTNQISAKIKEQCDNRRTELKTEAGYAGCYNGFVGELAAAMRLQDTALLKAYQDGLMAVAIASDAGQLNATQVGAIYGALAQAYGDAYWKQLTDWRARINKPLGDRYVAQFDKAYADLRAGKPPLAAGPVLVLDAAAASSHEKAKNNCTAQRASLKTETVYRTCLMAANRAYTIAIKFNDMDLFEAFVSTALAAAADSDAGRLTKEQSDYVQTRLGNAFDAIRDKRNIDWQNRTDQPLIERYRARFEKAYAAAARPLDDRVPPYDTAARPQALEEANASATRCNANRGTFSNNVAYFQCFADLQLGFAAAIKLQDKVLLEPFVSALLAVAADADAGRITPEQSGLVYVALTNAYTEIYQRQNDVWQANAAKPLLEERLARFQMLYRNAQAVSGPPPADAPPFEFAADKAASTARAKAVDACTARGEELKTLTAKLECRLAANRVYLAAIKIRDMALFESWATISREAAADLDSGKLSSAQGRAVAAAIDRAYNAARRDAIIRYQLHQPAVIARVRGFDNDYFAARKAHGAPPAGAPQDEAALPIASAARDRALAACNDRRDEMKTNGPWMVCQIAAQRDFAAATKLRDMILVEFYTAALRTAADDADAGKLSRDQFDAIGIGIGYAYNAILADQVQAWKGRKATK